MCGSKFLDPGREARRAAQQGQHQENLRQIRAKKGVDKVNQAFSGFDDEFFQTKFRDPAEKFYTSSVKDQSEDARRALLSTIAGRGLTGSSVESRELDRFNRRQGDAFSSALDRAQQAESSARSRIESNRAQLEDFALNASDPATAATRAQTQAAVHLGANASFDPIGNMFEGFSPLIGAQIRGRNEGRDNTASQLFGPPTSSARVIR